MRNLSSICRFPRVHGLLATVTAVPLLLGAAAPPSPAPATDPAAPEARARAILNATGRVYSTLASLQVKVRTEIPLPRGKPKVMHFSRRVRDLLPVPGAPPFEVGTYVAEREWRIVRDRALRLRAAHLDSRGACASYLPDSTTFAGYDSGTIRTSAASRPIGTIESADGGLSFQYYTGGIPGVSADLPLKLFLSRDPAALLAAIRIEIKGTASLEGGSSHVLHLTVPHSVLQYYPVFASRKLLKATWTLWIDRETSVIQRVEVREEWQFPAKTGDKGKAEAEATPRTAVLELREVYTDQRLNPPLALADFAPEPPDPVQPAREKPKEGTEAEEKAAAK